MENMVEKRLPLRCRFGTAIEMENAPIQLVAMLEESCLFAPIRRATLIGLQIDGFTENMEVISAIVFRMGFPGDC